MRDKAELCVFLCGCVCFLFPINVVVVAFPCNWLAGSLNGLHQPQKRSALKRLDRVPISPFYLVLLVSLRKGMLCPPHLSRKVGSYGFSLVAATSCPYATPSNGFFKKWAELHPRNFCSVSKIFGDSHLVDQSKTGSPEEIARNQNTGVVTKYSVCQPT